MSRARMHFGVAATLLAAGLTPTGARAESALEELRKEISELKAENKVMRQAIAQNKEETRRIAKVRPKADSQTKTLARVPSTQVAVAAPTSLPAGVTPTFVNSIKQMQYGPITITPGGFFEAVGIYRSRSLQSDITSSFGNLPFNSSALAHQGEARVTERASRAALLLEAAITPNVFAAGYAEIDFKGSGTSSNNNIVSGYVPQVRNLYATLDVNDYGLHLLAGQNWSLLVTNSKGITPRNEVVPPVIDQAFVVGFEYSRVPQIRLVKDFDRKLWVALSLENPSTVVTGCPSIVGNNGALATTSGPNSLGNGAAANAGLGSNGVLNVACTAIGNGNFAQAGESQALSLNKIPDVLGKVAYEQRLGNRDVHYEATGIYRNFYDNVAYGAATNPTTGYPTASNKSTNGYGVGAGVIVPVFPRKLDFQLSGVYGKGVGRYTAASLPDATLRGDGALTPIKTASALVGAIYHATPSIDVFAFAGLEQASRTYTTTAAGTQVGYGVTLANNAGCNFEGGVCSGQTHRFYEGVVGFWDKLYKGPFGEFRVGVNYSYVQRQLFAAQATPTSPFIAPRAHDNIFLTSLRYYPFQ